MAEISVNEKTGRQAYNMNEDAIYLNMRKTHDIVSNKLSLKTKFLHLP